MRLSELAEALGCPYEGDGEAVISRVGALSDSGDDCLGYVRSDGHLRQLRSSKLGIEIDQHTRHHQAPRSQPALVIEDPRQRQRHQCVK